MKQIFLTAIIATLFVTACNKPDTPAPPSLAGKWGVVNYQEKEWDNGVSIYDNTYIGKPADYIEFKSDNTVSYFIDRFGFIVPYQLQTDNKVVIDGEPYTIQSLTANSAMLYLKYNYSTTNYDETTINLKRYRIEIS